jgi:hypothetical protein
MSKRRHIVGENTPNNRWLSMSSKRNELPSKPRTGKSCKYLGSSSYLARNEHVRRSAREKRMSLDGFRALEVLQGATLPVTFEQTLEG